MKPVSVYLLLGSNLGNRNYNIREALRQIGQMAGIVRALSGIYETEPWGFKSELLFFNQAVEIESSFAPDELLKAIVEIETNLGRKREGARYNSRAIDIDIIFFSNQIIQMPGLVIPHPLLHLRRFVLVPLAEIAGGYIHPVFNKSVTDLLRECPDTSLVRKPGG
jgi:2-amino-4-hydroxy-6-hydroxymethyldihydropteridine diphosphokinase